MATRIDDDSDGYIFQWKIRNISQCWWLKNEDFIDSPAFLADSLHCTKWRLWLYPIGVTDKRCVDLLLYREENCSGPDIIEINYQLAFLDKDGILFEEGTTTDSFRKDNCEGYNCFGNRERILFLERETLLPEDTLTVQCTIWSKIEKPIKPKHLFGQTIFKTSRRSLVWRIDKFSSQKFALKNKLKDDLIDFDLVLNEKEGFRKEIVIKMNSYDESMKYFSFNAYIIDSKGKRENCVRKEFFAYDLTKRVLSLMLDLPEMMKDKSLYLKNDSLCLYCEFVFATETTQQVNFGCDIISTELKTEHHVGQEKSPNIPVLTDDLKSMLNDGIFSDMELRTSTQSFPVHKCILSARSSVFRRMFSNDMKETNSGHVDIADIEGNIVHRLLMYIYTDFLEDLQFQIACKLYEAADKYDILSLKSKCSSFLKDNMCETEVCNILILADQHQDHDLKSAVQDYILDHDEVFSSQEWLRFMDTNIKLAADMMHKKINFKK